MGQLAHVQRWSWSKGRAQLGVVVGGRTGLSNFVLCFDVLSFSILVSLCNYFFSITDAYPNIKRQNFGDHFKLEIPHVSIWHRVQAQSHWENHLTCGKTIFLACIFVKFSSTEYLHFS